MVRKNNLGGYVNKLVRRLKKTVTPLLASVVCANTAYAGVNLNELSVPVQTGSTEAGITGGENKTQGSTSKSSTESSFTFPLFSMHLGGEDGRYIEHFDAPNSNRRGSLNGLSGGLTFLTRDIYINFDTWAHSNVGPLTNILFEDGTSTWFTQGQAKVLEDGGSLGMGYKVLPEVILSGTVGLQSFKVRAITPSALNKSNVAVFQSFGTAYTLGGDVIISLLNDKLALHLGYKQARAKSIPASYVDQEPSAALRSPGYRADPSFQKSRELHNKKLEEVGTHNFEGRLTYLLTDLQYVEAFALSQGNTEHCGKCIGDYAKVAGGVSAGTYVEVPFANLLVGPIVAAVKHESGRFGNLVEFEEGFHVNIVFNLGFVNASQSKAYLTPKTR
jgi:hypothetical protein